MFGSKKEDNRIFCVYNSNTKKITKGLTKTEVFLINDHLDDATRKITYVWFFGEPHWKSLSEMTFTLPNIAHDPNNFAKLPPLPATPKLSVVRQNTASDITNTHFPKGAGPKRRSRRSPTRVRTLIQDRDGKMTFGETVDISLDGAKINFAAPIDVDEFASIIFQIDGRNANLSVQVLECKDNSLRCRIDKSKSLDFNLYSEWIGRILPAI